MTAAGRNAVKDDTLHLGSRLKVFLMIFDSPKEKSEKAKVLKKLVSQWLSVQGTERKATMVLSKNPELKMTPPAKKRKSPH